jgi:hypothetical protein
LIALLRRPFAMCLSAPAAGASARDTGNRTSLAGLRGFAVTRDFHLY